MKQKMKILLTGTHFTPAVAVIEQLQKNYGPDLELIYVGRNTTREGDKSLSIEAGEIPKLGLKFISLTTGRIQRGFNRYTIPSLFKIPFGMVQAFWILIKEKPDAVVSFGGYVGFPLIFAAWWLSIPTLVHDQTLVMGLANRASSYLATKLAVSFEDQVKKSSGKIVFTGNPIRQQILTPESLTGELESLIQKTKKPIILVTGGNQGSHIINQLVINNLPALLEKYTIIHQTGDSKLGDFESALEKVSADYYPVKFINSQMGSVLTAVDLVICRAGINTLDELAYLQKRAVVIPIPFIHGDEQVKNAKYFEKVGLCIALSQKDLNFAKFEQAITEGLKIKVPSTVKELVVADAANRLALEIILLVNKNES